MDNDEAVTELRRLAEECNFVATLTERLRDQLVCGIKDEALQRRLLAESILTFNEAFSRAVAAESAAEQAKHIHSQKLNTGNSTNLIRQHSNNNKRTFQKSSSSQSKPGNAQSADVICYGCVGHHDRSSYELDRLWPNKKPKIFPLTFQLCDYQKSRIRIRGQIYVNVRYANFKGKLRLLIAEASRANLLGMEWFEPLGIKFVGVYRTEIDIEFVLEEFKDVFSEDLGSYKGPAISLPIDPKFPPISFKARNIPLAMRKKVDIAIDKLLNQGVLEPISNPKWSTPIVPIIKQSGEIRLCADYKVTFNKAMKNNPFPLPSVNHILANLADGKFFAKIDLAQVYLQLRVDDASAEAQTILTHRGAFKVNRL
ncbi:Uncharacterized protein K02A2.6 [Araneus ventricosus]|uniref:Uncharacterized protein K02A2.6 n=1 Tax=Araneus ventricosus TaxID=182803 RepID=A0A4Y2VGP0_ARAVE|nr:Uncharacterized protein K02A2.6 [Araneus ventricosus]